MSWDILKHDEHPAHPALATQMLPGHFVSVCVKWIYEDVATFVVKYRLHAH